MKIMAALLSKKGGRRRNEDHVAYEECNKCGCFLVADGLGGHQGGEVASKTACEGVLEAFRQSPGTSADQLKGYLEHAGRQMESLRTEAMMKDSAKTTLVVLLIDGSQAIWAHIGDSRLYRFKWGRVVFQTRDHSLPQRLVDIGEITPEQIRMHEDRNRLTSVFEGNDTSRFTVLDSPLPVERGDAFLLCSDGFWDYVYEEEMESDLSSSDKPAAWLSKMQKRLLKRVDQEHDNYSALGVMTR